MAPQSGRGPCLEAAGGADGAEQEPAAVVETFQDGALQFVDIAG
jgi:hypothetical protein